jgi:ABC-type Fe3+-hydroxamate transport system substrate-binding protein
MLQAGKTAPGRFFVKRACVILILISSLVLVTACALTGPAATTAGSQTTGSVTESTTALADQFPVTVKDSAGNTVVISKAPQSIVITNVWAAEMLLDIVDPSRIKGLSAWGDNPVLSVVAEKAKAVAARVKTGEPEGIITLKPDLVIIDTFSDPDGSLTKNLKDAGAVVLQMASPTNFDQIKEAIAIFASAVGETAKGQSMIAAIDSELKAVADKLAGLADSQKKKVLYYEDYYDQSGSNAGMLAAYGEGSPFDAIAAAAGTINVCNAANYSAISKEKVVDEWKPDLLIVPAIRYNTDFTVVDDHGVSIIEAIKADSLLQTLPAIQNGSIYALTEKYRGSTSQYMVYAVAELAAKAYPDLFPEK